MAKFDIALFPQSRQPTLSCIKEPVLFQIIFRIDPLFLEFSPYRFRNIQMRRVWWQESDEQSTLLPKRYPFHNTVGFMHTGIIQYQYGFLFNAEREFLQIFNERIGSDIRFCHYSHILALSVDKTKDIFCKTSQPLCEHPLRETASHKAHILANKDEIHLHNRGLSPLFGSNVQALQSQQSDDGNIHPAYLWGRFLSVYIFRQYF